MEEEPSDTTGPRRPVPARDLPLSKTAAQWLAGRGVGANAISVAGLVFAIAAGVVLTRMPLQPPWSIWCWLLVAGLVELRLLANMLDGMVAILSRTVSKHGELYNELPDRLSDIAVLVGLGYAPGGDALLGFVAALAAVLTAYIRAAGTAAGATPEFCGPMAKPQRMHAVALTSIAVAGATVLDVADEMAAGVFGLPALALLVIIVGSVLTCLHRVVRIARALR